MGGGSPIAVDPIYDEVFADVATVLGLEGLRIILSAVFKEENLSEVTVIC